MLRLFLFNAGILLGVFVFTLEAKIIAPSGCRYSFCSYTGDPHLIPFSQPNTMYWCQKPGWELLLSNDYVTIYVLVDGASSAYSIIDYMLVFPGPPSCNAIGSSSNAWPCTGASSPVWTLGSGSTRIYYHKTQCLIIKIVKWGPYFNIYIWQSPALVKRSCGVCVNWNCPLESRNPFVNDVVPQICNSFVEAARAQVIGTVDPAMIELAKISCVNDINTSLDIENAKAAATLVLQNGLELLLAGDDPEGVFNKLEEAEKIAVQDATLKANSILSTAEKICNANRCLGSDNSTTTVPDTKPPTTTAGNTRGTSSPQTAVPIARQAQ